MKHSSLSRLLLVSLLVSTAVAPSQAMEGDETGVRLSLDEALRMALENNLDLVAARKDPEIALQAVIAADSEFDGVLSASVTHAESKDEPTSIVVPGVSKADDGSASWSQSLRIGGEYTIRYAANRTDAASFFRAYNPSYRIPLTLQWRLPLLQGFGKESTTRNVLLARSDVAISEVQLRGNAEGIIRDVEGAYWDVLAARAAVDVSRQSLQLARDLLDLNRKKVEVGTLAPIEVTQAEAGVASREEGVIQAEAALETAEDNLRRLLAFPPEDDRWGRRILPSDQPKFDPVAVDLNGAIELAKQNRPDLETARIALEKAELRERTAKKDTRHGFDFVATAGSIGNNLKDVIPVTLPGPDGVLGTSDDVNAAEYITGGAGTAFEESFKFRNYDWTVGFAYRYPIGNRAAKAGYASATLQREKTEVEYRTAEQAVRVDVRNAVRSVESGGKRVKAAEANTVLQRKTLEAEQKKFENGMSTSFEVLRIQTDLADAQLSRIRAILDYNKALADLERAQGTLLEARGLQLGESGTNE